MAKVIKIIMHDKAFVATMKDKKMRKIIQAQVDGIKDAAGPGHRAEVQEGRTRVRGTVTAVSASARKKESQDKNLTRAALSKRIR